jgi:hypothetical protein
MEIEVNCNFFLPQITRIAQMKDKNGKVNAKGFSQINSLRELEFP